MADDDEGAEHGAHSKSPLKDALKGKHKNLFIGLIALGTLVLTYLIYKKMAASSAANAAAAAADPTTSTTSGTDPYAGSGYNGGGGGGYWGSGSGSSAGATGAAGPAGPAGPKGPAGPAGSGGIGNKQPALPAADWKVTGSGYDVTTAGYTHLNPTQAAWLEKHGDLLYLESSPTGIYKSIEGMKEKIKGGTYLYGTSAEVAAYNAAQPATKAASGVNPNVSTTGANHPAVTTHPGGVQHKSAS